MVWWLNMDGPKFWIPKMSNFDIYVVHLAFGAILGDPKFGPFHVGSPHHMAVTGYTWLTLVINCSNELCSPSNNTVSKAFWQKKVLPEQRISYCEGIYTKAMMHKLGFFEIWLFHTCLHSRMVNILGFKWWDPWIKSFWLIFCHWIQWIHWQLIVENWIWANCVLPTKILSCKDNTEIIRLNLK